MTRGRKPKPTPLAEASGALKKDPQRRNKKEPQPTKGAPPIPRHLIGPAKKKWFELIEVLDEMKVLATSDADLLALFCETHAAYRVACKNVKVHGQVLVTTNAAGTVTEVKRNPFSTELHRYADRLQKLCVELGLTPSARTRIIIHEPADANPLKMYEAIAE